MPQYRPQVTAELVAQPFVGATRCFTYARVSKCGRELALADAIPLFNHEGTEVWGIKSACGCNLLLHSSPQRRRVKNTRRSHPIELAFPACLWVDDKAIPGAMGRSGQGHERILDSHTLDGSPVLKILG